MLLIPEFQVLNLANALRQRAAADPLAAEVLPLIPAILLSRFNDRPIQEICAMGEAPGEARGEANVTLRQLSRRCGPLTDATTARIQALPLEQLEALADALLDFQGPADLADWLAQHT
jgi:hypothetical protein